MKLRTLPQLATLALLGLGALKVTAKESYMLEEQSHEDKEKL
jgi:hypothetical protein